MPQASPIPGLKQPGLKEEVRDFWNADPCGSRYLGDRADFEAHARTRYRLEPHIHEFAGFARSAGKRVLEVGVGMGADYLEWLKAGAQATGIDLSSASLEQAKRRCEMAGCAPDLHVSDAEHLTFPDGTFDIVYSYGVMHHSPDTPQCIREGWRVLKPGGALRIMIYHHPSLTGFMLWLRYGWLRGKSLRQVVRDRLESPGTKSYTQDEAHALLQAFEQIEFRQVFSPGDLLLNEPSTQFRGWAYRIIWRLYPRFLVRRFGGRLALFLLISARKPAAG
ncbi:MAG TPA: class I SAM-dependent methyltransferase [Terriglobales bacterium]|nr:class I SAM-dependent methyltransferase [Terriglobales bacterium]